MEKLGDKQDQKGRIQRIYNCDNCSVREGGDGVRASGLPSGASTSNGQRAGGMW